MREDTSTPAAVRPGTSLLGAVIAAAGAGALGISISTLLEMARTSHGSETLILWVLLGLAGLGTVLCLRLALVWGLAAMILVAGPASRTGAALLGPLRVLAPRLARRIASGAAVATAATALTLTPGMASQDLFETEPAAGTVPASATAELRPAEAPPTEPAPDASAPRDGGTSDAGIDVPLPPLGWGGGSASGATDTIAPAAPPDGAPDPHSTDADADADASTSTDPNSPEVATVHTVVVHQGDSLWSISDDLLGPGPSDPAEIATAWPLLHETNRDVIGEDPDQLRPGQQLTVPAAMTTQDQS